MPIKPNGYVPDEKNAHVFKLVEYAIENYNNQDFFTIGIGGPGGAGKTTLARNIRKFIGEDNGLTLDLDGYLIPRQKRGELGITGYNPAANKLHLARQNITDLRQGKKIVKPRYDHRTGLCLPDEEVSPMYVIIAEGVTTFYPELKGLYDLALFLDATDDTVIRTRIVRDVRERGYTVDEAVALFQDLKSDTKEFVAPTKRHADAVLRVNPDYRMDILRISHDLISFLS